MDFFDDTRGHQRSLTLAGHYDAVAFDFLAMLWRRRAMILSFAGAAALLAILALMVMPNRYVADLALQFDFSREDGGRGIKSMSAVTLEPGALVESEARIIRSLPTARAVVSRLGLDKAPDTNRSGLLSFLVPASVRSLFGKTKAETDSSRRDRIAQQLLGTLNVSNDAKAYLIGLSYRDRDPERAAAIVNAFAQEYSQRKMEAATSAASRSNTWYAQQVKEARGDLSRIESRIDSFRTRTGFIEIGQDGADLQQQLLRDTITQLNIASAARLAGETRLRRAQESLAAGNVPQATDLVGSPVVQAILDEESKVRRSLDELISVTGERHPTVLRLRATLQGIQDRLKQQLAQAVANLETDLQSARTVEEKLSAQITELQQKSITAKGFEAQLQSIQVEAIGARERLKQLLEAQQASAGGEPKPVMAQIVAPAEVPTIPASANSLLVLGLAMGGGLAAGASLAYLLEKRDRGYRTEEEFAYETQINCVGLFPNLDRFPNGLESLVFAEAVRSAVAELFPPVNPPKVVLITSSAPGEGKSFVASAMARVLSAMGQSVLVVDGCPRRLFPGSDLPHEAILDQCLPQFGPADLNANRISTVRRASGLRDGQNVYSNPAFEAMLREARSRYDVILFEVAPVLLSADSALLRDHVDTVLHVVKWNATLKSTVATTLDHLSRLGLHVGGTLLNSVNLEEQGRFNASDRGRIYRDYKSFYQASA